MRQWTRCTVGCAVAWALGTGLAGAQVADPHAALPERPSVATHAYTVAPGWLEMEAGWERTQDDGRLGDASLPVTLKLGLAPRAQLNVSTSITRPSGGASIDDVTVGLKWRPWDHAPVAGAIAVLPSVTLSTRSAGASGDTAAGLLVITSRPIGAMALDLNAGYTWRSGDGSLAPSGEALWAAALGGPVAGRVSWVGEVYGSPASSGPAGTRTIVSSLIGASAAVNPSLVLDVAVVLPLTGPDSRAVMAGIVWNAGSLWRRRSVVP